VQTFTLVGHSMGGTVAYLMAQQHPSRIDRLILEDTPPPSPRATQASPTRPEVDLPFDWAVIPAITDQLNNPDPTLWDRLIDITAPTLIIVGGPRSVIPQDSLKEVAMRIPTCSMKTIPVGHHVHKGRPEEFNAAVAAFLGTSQ